MRMRFLPATLILAFVLASCAPGQPRFNVPVLPSATSIPMPKSAQATVTLTERMSSFDVSPDDRFIAVATDKGAIVYALEGYQPVRTLNQGEPETRVAWSPDGSQLAVGGAKDYGKPFYVGGDSTNSWKAHLTVYDTTSWKVVFEPPFGNGMVNQSFYDIAWAPDGRSLAFSTDLGGVEVMDLENGQVISQQGGFAGTVTDIAWSPDGTRLLATNDMAYTMRRWKLSDNKFVRLFDPRSSAYRTVEWSPDGTRIASGDGLGGLCFWTAATNKCDGFVHAHRTATFSLAWSPDGSQIATGGGVIRIWDTRTGALVRAFGEDSSFIYEKVQWLKQDAHLVAFEMSITGTPASVIRIWNISNGALIAEWRGQ